MAFFTSSSTSALFSHDSANRPSVLVFVSQSDCFVKVLKNIGRAVSGRKMSRKGEQWEQMLGVEERVPRRDAAAIELEDDQCPGCMAPARRGPILPEA